MKRYLIDLDGTLYRGDQPVEGAAQFIDSLNRAGRDYLLVTNCPLNSAGKTAQRLQRMGIEVNEERVLNSGMACADYLRNRMPSARVYLIGSEDLRATFEQAGIALCQRDADAVVVGYDQQMTYAQLERACLELLAGASFIATNLDNVIPGKGSMIPHTGAIVAALRCATGLEPLVVGKPAEPMLQSALKLLGCGRKDCAVIGDRLDTDMAFALENGVDGYLVLTGCTTPEMLRRQRPAGIRVFKDLTELMRMEEQQDELL